MYVFYVYLLQKVKENNLVVVFKSNNILETELHFRLNLVTTRIIQLFNIKSLNKKLLQYSCRSQRDLSEYVFVDCSMCFYQADFTKLSIQ